MNTISESSSSPVLRSLPADSIPVRDDLRRLINQSALLDQITSVTLPFWLTQCYSPASSGFVLGYDALVGSIPETRRLLVSQARLLWTFSRAHRRGYSQPSRDYLAAAEYGYRTIVGQFRDSTHGGYYWSTEEGQQPDARKALYAQSFLIFAFVEYFRSSGSQAALEEALTVFRWIENDRKRRSLERPLDILPRVPTRSLDTTADIAGVAIKGYRCANTALHWMEALIELYAETLAPEVRIALSNSLLDNRNIFFPAKLDDARMFTKFDAAARSHERAQLISYGHNVEAGWLMLHAQKVLGIARDFQHHRMLVDHALRFGFDHQLGGVFNSGPVASGATDRGKTWWTQAEMIIALCYLIASNHAEAQHVQALKQLLIWYLTVQMDTATGSPMWEMLENGSRHDTRISGPWQAAYHDLRARWTLLDLLENRLRP